MSFLEMLNLFETNINFTKQSKTKYRLQLSIVLIVIFIILCLIKVLDDLDDNLATSILSLNDYVKISNAGTIKFQPDIYTKANDTPNSCNISVHLKLLGINYGTKDLIKEKYKEDNSFIRHYLLENLNNTNIIDDSDYFNLESKIYFKCVDDRNKSYDKSSYEKVEAPTIFINNNNEYDKVLKLTNDEPLVALKKPFMRINNHSKDEISDVNQIMINSWEFKYEPVKVLDDKDYFSISRLKNRDLDKDYSKDFTIHSTNSKLTKVMVADTYSDKGVLIGFISYRLSKTGKLIVRTYPKMTDSIPILLLCILFTIYIFKVIFYIYDYNGIHCEYVNTFFNLTYEDSKPLEDKGNKSTFISKKTNISKLSNDPSSDKSMTMETNTNTQILIEKQHSFNENLFKSQDNNLSIFQYKSPKQAIKETKIFIGSSFIETNNSIENNSKEDKEEIKLDENKNEVMVNDESLKQYSFTFIDLLAFYCPFSKNSKLKKNLYMNCKNQLDFYLNPLYYFKLCALNEENVVDYLAENKVYSANFSYQRGIFDISRNMSVLKKLRKSQEIREEKNTEADDRLVIITPFMK